MPGNADDSIAALSTPGGSSGLAVLRLSGPAGRDVLANHLGKPDWKPRHMYHGSFRDPASGEILDRLNFVFLPAPRSPTGEDVLELYPHGNMLLVESLLTSLLAVPGVRLAEPGEFTRRGFENGKIDLLQAEAVGDLIHAQTRQALRNAQKTVAGGLSARLRGLRDKLLDVSARLELDVDFSEEEADPDYASWQPRITEIRALLEDLSRGFAKGKDLGRAPRIAFLGSPNAGKSSLINALVEEERLLVSDAPGTTRDYVDVTMRLPGGVVHLVDTAGLGAPIDGLDELAMERSRGQMEKADIRVLVQDGADPNAAAGEFAEAEFHLRVLTKTDLPGFRAREGFMFSSSKTREGLGDLVSRLNALAFEGMPEGEDILITTERQFQGLEAARQRVQAALDNLRSRPAIEIVAFEIREAGVCLRELLGEISTDEVLHRIFAGFCIGK